MYLSALNSRRVLWMAFLGSAVHALSTVFCFCFFLAFSWTIYEVNEMPLPPAARLPPTTTAATSPKTILLLSTPPTHRRPMSLGAICPQAVPVCAYCLWPRAMSHFRSKLAKSHWKLAEELRNENEELKGELKTRNIGKEQGIQRRIEKRGQRIEGSTLREEL